MAFLKRRKYALFGEKKGERGGRKVGEANGNKRPPDRNRQGLCVRVLKGIKWMRIKKKKPKKTQHGIGSNGTNKMLIQHS